MKPAFTFAAFILLAGTLVNTSCKKEYSCENCLDVNESPIAHAGIDTAIVLPVDSVLLNGSRSGDPDGNISNFEWTTVSGPVSFNFTNPSMEKTIVKNLTVGSYLFELKVTDNGGLPASDTVQIIVSDPAQTNQPPIARAGADQNLRLPGNSVALDGSTSTDPDNNIISYHWEKISGPASFKITNANAAETQVENLVEGVYQFEIKVTDAGGLFSKDTMLASLSDACVIIGRPLVNAQLIQVGTIPQTRWRMAVTSIGTKIIFAGGYTVYGRAFSSEISRIDIYDIVTGTWSTAELSQPRWGIVTAVLGNKVYFAGGRYSPNGVPQYSSRVDVFDVTTNIWTTTELSSGAIFSAGAAAGDKVLFAGGFREYGPSKTVDIYNASTKTWSKDSLTDRKPEATDGIAATVIGEKIYFAGASEWAWDFGQNSSTINIYNSTFNTWSVSHLKNPRGYMAAIAVGNHNYWAGGNGHPDYYATSDQVEIRDMTTGVSRFDCLFQGNTYFSAIQKDNKIVFFTGAWGGLITNKFDIYDITSDSWSIGVLPQDIEDAAIFSINNTIYVAGGVKNHDYTKLFNQIWKLEF